jgi:twitching motility protein PilT
MEKKRLLPDPELEQLISRLNDTAQGTESEPDQDADPVFDPAVPRPARARWSLPARNEEGVDRLHRLLGIARDGHASDLVLVVGAPPVVRVHGALRRLDGDPLRAPETAMLCAALLPDVRRPALESVGAVDFAFTRPGLGRFRTNIHRERGHWAAAVRLLPERVPDLDALNLPAALERFADLAYGLVLVTGPTGSGKSTTLAALLKRILSRRQVHVITIEDPVEYAHVHGKSVVEHIEIGRDADTFAGALRAAMRQDPDVLLVGEMRDPESISNAITAAETGHLVLSTLHTGDAPQTVHRILDSYPPNQIETVRVQLSISLAGVISQQLLPRKDGRGRVPAVEVLVATTAVRNLIRQGKLPQIRSQLTLEKAAGMLELDRSLARLVAKDLVDRDEARTRARIPDEFDQLLAGLRR